MLRIALEGPFKPEPRLGASMPCLRAPVRSGLHGNSSGICATQARAREIVTRLMDRLYPGQGDSMNRIRRQTNAPLRRIETLPFLRRDEDIAR